MKEKSQFSYSKQIVFINQSSGTLMVDIVNAFGIKYEKLVLITGTKGGEKYLAELSDNVILTCWRN